MRTAPPVQQVVVKVNIALFFTSEGGRIRRDSLVKIEFSDKIIVRLTKVKYFKTLNICIVENTAVWFI